MTTTGTCDESELLHSVFSDLDSLVEVGEDDFSNPKCCADSSWFAADQGGIAFAIEKILALDRNMLCGMLQRLSSARTQSFGTSVQCAQ